MDGLFMLGLLLMTSALALGSAKAFLTLIFRLMAGPQIPSITIHWRPLIFIVALFWFWYLTPAWAAHVVESPTIARVVNLLAP